VKIDSVTIPPIEGKTPAEALAVTYDLAAKTARLLVQLNGEVEELKARLDRLERR